MNTKAPNHYALFGGHNYYPMGGFCDYRGTGTIRELMDQYNKESLEYGSNYSDPWGQIVDLKSMSIHLETLRYQSGVVQEWTDDSGNVYAITDLHED